MITHQVGIWLPQGLDQASEPDYYPLRGAAELGPEGALLRLGPADLDSAGFHHVVPSHCSSHGQSSLLLCGSGNQ